MATKQEVVTNLDARNVSEEVTCLSSMTDGKWPNGLADALRASGVSQSELAREVHESRQQINRWVKGARELTAPIALKLAPVLKTSPQALLLLPEEAVIQNDQQSADQPLNENDDRGMVHVSRLRLVSELIDALPRLTNEDVDSISSALDHALELRDAEQRRSRADDLRASTIRHRE